MRLLFLVGRLPFSQSPFFFSAIVFIWNNTHTPRPPPPLFSRTPSSIQIQREREKKGERDSIEREENPSEFAIGKFCVRVS